MKAPCFPGSVGRTEECKVWRLKSACRQQYQFLTLWSYLLQKRRNCELFGTNVTQWRFFCKAHKPTSSIDFATQRDSFRDIYLVHFPVLPKWDQWGWACAEILLKTHRLSRHSVLVASLLPWRAGCYSCGTKKISCKIQTKSSTKYICFQRVTEIVTHFNTAERQTLLVPYVRESLQALKWMFRVVEYSSLDGNFSHGRFTNPRLSRRSILGEKYRFHVSNWPHMHIAHLSCWKKIVC